MSAHPASSSIAPGLKDAAAIPAIRLSGVTVAYRSYNQRPTSLKESVIRTLKHGFKTHYTPLNALKNISLEIPRGRVFGLIGSNGSGKSTLLKVIGQVLKPVQGTVEVNGSIASLIELGVGFDPELNAIENIYLNGSLHRKSAAQIKPRVQHILDFAELNQFATTPIKYYSSGMAARLGFAVAVDIDPDILLVDEILGVGDERFQAKCDAVFQNFLRSGKTIVLVSHDLNMIERNCEEVAVLSRGEIIFIGDPATGVHLYRDPAYRTALD